LRKLSAPARMHNMRKGGGQSGATILGNFWRGGATLLLARHLQHTSDMHGEDPKPSVQTCVECGAKSPQTETNYTLISSRYGWRLSLETLPDGRRASYWRCPTCWEKHRKKQMGR
jgi:hypothetical protein